MPSLYGFRRRRRNPGGTFGSPLLGSPNVINTGTLNDMNWPGKYCRKDRSPSWLAPEKRI
jgi:hypothetical protein